MPARRGPSFVCCDIRTYQIGPTQAAFLTTSSSTRPTSKRDVTRPSPDFLRAGALGHQKDDLSLEDWIKAAHRLVKSGGSFTMIYPASGTDRILRALGKKFGAIDIIPLWPRAWNSSQARYYSGHQGPENCHPASITDLVLHEADGSYTEAAEAILRSGQALC
jgi:tRNA1(Val) A37 N6-methylase TrmN6